jgi:catechol 2,3-dioxygenase-like lactoylglutathione lyase family enzyme
MFTHIVVGSNDLGKSKQFYDAVFGALGVGPGMAIGDTRVAYQGPAGSFMVTKPINGQAATFANGGTIGFKAESPEKIDAWHAAGCANGGKSCEDPPGVRDMGFAKMYLAYLRDPDGNKLVAVYNMAS